MLFSEIINQDKVRQQLLQMLKQQRLSHALLFLAPEGSGGLLVALAFAQYLLCENKQESNACGECNSCKKAAQYIHPDIHYSYPVIPKKSGDKPISTDYVQQWRDFLKKYPYGNAYDWLQFIDAGNRQGNITTEECQDIMHKLNLKTFESEYKILIMWLPEYLGKNGNRLLKLIEEPPDKTLMIFVTENQDKILNTILSRTQLVRINRLSNEVIQKALVEREGISEQQAAQLAALSEGNYREAIYLLRQDVNDLLDPLRQWLNYILLNDSKSLIKWVDEMGSSKQGRENQKYFLRYFLALIRHAIQWQYMPQEQLSMHEEEADFASKLLKMASFNKLTEMTALLDDACYHIERNANGKMLFHALSLRLKYIFANKTLYL